MAWPYVELGELISHRKEFIEISPDVTYARCRVQTSARGIVLRDRVAGSEIKTKKQQVCRTGEFLVAEIDAKMGGYGIVPPDLDGAIVSSHYFLFEVDERRLLRGFLEWYSRTPAFLEQIAARGSTNYASVRPANVLGYQVPLPSLDEQRRIVALLDHVAEGVEGVRSARSKIIVETKALIRALILGSPASPSPLVPFRKIARQRPVDVLVEPDGDYQFAGVFSFGRGMFVGERKLGSEFSYAKLTKVRKDDFVYPKLMAWEGALAVVPDECDGCYVSPEFPVFELDAEALDPVVADAYFRSPSVWPTLSGTSRGTNLRRRRLHPEVLLEHPVPVPPARTQQTIKELLCRYDPFSPQDRNDDLHALIPAMLHEIFNGKASAA